MTASYNVHQQVFALSMISNYLIKMEGPAPALLQQLKSHIGNFVACSGSTSTPSATMIQLLGAWSVVWGPVIYQAPGSTVSDNGMMVLQSRVALADGSTKDTYVVAIAGTAAMSAFDWEREDGVGGPRGDAIRTVVSWTDFVASPSTTVVPPVAGEPYISHGTATGLCTLLAMVDPSREQTLTEFLATVGADLLVVTGHSLGGALSAGLGLYLAQSEAAPRIATTYVYPTAGASPGNDVFAQSFAGTLPPVHDAGDAPWQSWNVDIWNDLDIVPQAWSIAAADSTIRTLRNIDDIYGNRPDGTRTPILVEMLSKRLANWSKTSEIVYTPVGGARIPGSPVTEILATPTEKSIPLTVPPGDLRDFLGQALYQHSYAYSDAIFGKNALPTFTTPFVDGVSPETRLGMIEFFAKLVTIGAREPATLAAAE